MFAENLKYLREKMSLDQIDLAKKLGRKSPSTISEWEKGRYTPKIKTLNEISKIFDVDIDDLMNKDLSSDAQENDIEDIYKLLAPKRQQKVYSYAKKQLDEQLTEEKQEAEIYTLAAHAADPEHEFTDDEIEHIDTFLDQIEKKANTKNQKKKS